MSKPRPFPHRFRSAVLRAQLPATVKLLLLVLVEFADENGGSCYPALTTVAGLAGVNEKTARRELAKPCAYFERVTASGTGKSWRRYGYQLVIPEGADTTPARWTREGADTMSAADPGRCGHSDEKVRTFEPEGAGTVSDDIGLEIGKSRLEERADAARPLPGDSLPKVNKGEKPKRLTFQEWTALTEEDDGVMIPDDDPINRYSDHAGIPEDFMHLAWWCFCAKYRRSNKGYTAAEWQDAFRRHIRGNWLHLWRIDRDGDYVLTTEGEQNARAYMPELVGAAKRQIPNLDGDSDYDELMKRAR